MRRLVALLSVGIAGACANPTGPNDIVGTYFLRTVDGSPLPVIAWQSTTEKLEWTGGSLSLRANHSFSDSISGHTLTIADGDRTLVYARLW